MKKLFIVRMSNWKEYYVFAEDFNQAEQKTLQFLEEAPVVGENGDLNLPNKLKVDSIKSLEDNFIE